MRRLGSVTTLLLLAAILLLAGCGGAGQPSGPPPLVYGTATAGAGTPGSTNAGGKTVQILRLQNPVSLLVWSPDGKRLATEGDTNQGAVIQIWDVTTGQQLGAFGNQLGAIYALAWSPDSTRLVAGGGAAYSYTSNAIIWDAATGKVLLSFITDSSNTLSGVLSLAWSQDGARILALVATGPTPSGSTPIPPQKEEVQSWDAATGKLLSTAPVSIPFPRFAVAAWSPDGKKVAVGNADGTVQIWEVASGKLLLTYRGHNVTPLAIAWSPNGKAIASASGEPEVQVWDPATGSVFFRYHGHVGNVDALAWSPDGTRIVSGSQQAGGAIEDHPLQVWDAFTGQHPFYYTGQSESISALAWSPDGSEIASAGEATVQVWQAPQS